jgi:hypothetical protein
MEFPINYCAITFDGSIWKTVCRFWFNNEKKLAVETIDPVKPGPKKGAKHSINNIDGIFDLTDELSKTVECYLKGGSDNKQDDNESAQK